jgi:hypothetical protein
MDTTGKPPRKGKIIELGWLPPDHPINSRGLTISAGRATPQPKPTQAPSPPKAAGKTGKA